MIPTRSQCYLLFDRFNVPSQKKIHVEIVTELAMYFASKLKVRSSQFAVNEELLEASALLHDIDKNVKPKVGERHPDTAVRVLNELGFTEVAEIVKKHPLHAILDPQLTPQTWEEKILYLADKMVKYEIIGVDHRFKLWYKENLPPDAVKQLDAAYPKVKALEKEIFAVCGITFADIQNEFNS